MNLLIEWNYGKQLTFLGSLNTLYRLVNVIALCDVLNMLCVEVKIKCKVLALVNILTPTQRENCEGPLTRRLSKVRSD